MGTVRWPPAISRIRWRAAGSASTSYSTKSLRFHSSQSRISPVWGQRAAPKSSSLATGVDPLILRVLVQGALVQHLQRFADHVIDAGLYFLNAWDVIAIHHHGKVGEALAPDFTAVVAEQRDGQHVALARFFERHDDVARAAAGGNGDRYIFGASLRDQLAKKNCVGANVVGDCGDVR